MTEHYLTKLIKLSLEVKQPVQFDGGIIRIGEFGYYVDMYNTEEGLQYAHDYLRGRLILAGKILP